MADAPAEELTRMSIGDHIAELRLRLIKALTAIAVFFGVALCFQDQLMWVMTRPHAWAMERMDATYGKGSGQAKLITLTYQEGFMAYMKLAFIASLFVSSPIVAYQLWAFVATGLYKTERKWVYVYAPFTMLLFVLGCLFGYFVLIRFGLGYLATYGDRELMQTGLTLSMYLSLVMTMTIVAGGIFELPIIMMFLSKVGLVEPRFWHKFRRHMIVVIFIIAALLTPPDVVTQLLMAAPLLILYEFGVALAYLTTRKAAG